MAAPKKYFASLVDHDYCTSLPSEAQPVGPLNPVNATNLSRPVSRDFQLKRPDHLVEKLEGRGDADWAVDNCSNENASKEVRSARIENKSSADFILKTEKEDSTDANDDSNILAGNFSQKFSKCDKCRRSRTKVLVPDSILSVALGKNDGVTCDFCGKRMRNVLPPTLPNVFEGRRGSRGGDLIRKLKQNGSSQLQSQEDLLEAFENDSNQGKRKSYVLCKLCDKVVLKESLSKHRRDVHENTNKRECDICSKVLSGSFSLKEHISAVHKKVTKHECPHCHQMFAHFSNMTRHIRLLHDKMVITHKYVTCSKCSKVVQATSLKKHMETIHDHRRDFICVYCDKTFAQSYTLKEHVVAKHTHNFGHTCSFCRKSFAHKTNACRHVRTVHKSQIVGPDYEGNILKKYIVSAEVEVKLEQSD